jgi:hypothetical protein
MCSLGDECAIVPYSLDFTGDAVTFRLDFTDNLGDFTDILGGFTCCLRRDPGLGGGDWMLVPESTEECDQIRRAIEREHAHTGVGQINRERMRQVFREGFNAKHDDGQLPGAMAMAGSAYAHDAAMKLRGLGGYEGLPLRWPFGAEWWKPTPDDLKRQLIKAGALIAAEIDRMNREEARRG